jgi:hypothetical protein
LTEKPSLLSFEEEFARIKNKLGCEEWVDAFLHSEKEGVSEDIYCVLIDADKKEEMLNDPSWAFQMGDGLPEFVIRYNNGEKKTEYYRYSSDSIQPLAILRRFHGIRDDYWEISEEFRHYFNLFEDRKNERFFEIDNNGDEIDVVRMNAGNIKIKLNYIRDFLATKKMALLIQYEFDKSSPKTIKEQNIAEENITVKDGNYCYVYYAGDYDFSFDGKQKSYSRLYGVKVIDSFPTVKVRGFSRDDRKYEEFFIGFNEAGNALYFTCEETKLSDGYKNLEAPNYLTPVFFKKDVLTKYYSQPSKYSINDGQVSCAGLWSLRIDNNHTEYVMVFLGDLGRLEYKEQLHWKHNNLETKDKMSHTCFTRNFQVQFAPPEKSDLFFKSRYEQVKENWKKKMGWDLFQSLSRDDEYHLKTLRIPLTNEQKEFDEQVLSLTKLLIDSLNEKELVKGMPLLEPNSKGISKLEAFLQNRNFHSSQMIKFLRDLQELRSSGVAHLKGSQYDKMKKAFGIGGKELSNVFDGILLEAIKFLNTLDFTVLETKKELYGLNDSNSI